MATTGGVVTFTLAEEEASRHATPPCIHVPALEAGITVPLRLQVVFSFFRPSIHCRGVAQSSTTPSAVRLRQISNSTLQPAVLAPSEMLKPHPQLPDLPLAQLAN